MRIIDEPLQPGMYTERFWVYGTDSLGNRTKFLIMSDEADTFKEGIDFWNKNFGKSCKAWFIKNAKPHAYLSIECC